MSPRRLRRASPIDGAELLATPSWWASVWRWLRRAPAEPRLDQCGRWPTATRVIDRERLEPRDGASSDVRR
jgi:hypothetical protein